jgi:PadR family transcriptional regulator PadR
MKRTSTTLAVAAALLEDPDDRHWGYDLTVQAKVSSGTLYPILWRMFEAGWLADGWEDPATTGSRPARRYYTLTDLGRLELTALLSQS